MTNLLPRASPSPHYGDDDVGDGDDGDSGGPAQHPSLASQLLLPLAAPHLTHPHYGDDDDGGGGDGGDGGGGQAQPWPQRPGSGEQQARWSS